MSRKVMAVLAAGVLAVPLTAAAGGQPLNPLVPVPENHDPHTPHSTTYIHMGSDGAEHEHSHPHRIEHSHRNWTIYGRVQSGIYHLDSEGGTKASWDLGSVDAGDLGSGDKLWSRIGVRASYDLGNGMTSGLHIEKRLDNFRTRLQNVYLSGAFGKIILGQQGTPFHSAVSWDNTNLFGNWNTSPHGGSRGQGIQYSSVLDGPFSFNAMIRDDGSNPDGSGDGLDQYEITASFSMLDAATVSAGYLGQDDGGADVFGGSVNGSVAGFDWDVGYERTSEDNDRTNYGFFLGYAGAYVFYEDLNSENNTNEERHILLGYSRSLGTNTKVIIEHQRPDEGRNRTALAFQVNF